MGIFSVIFGLFGFGFGTCLGLLVGYFLFIYFQPTDVKVCFCSYFFASSFQSYYFLIAYSHSSSIFDLTVFLCKFCTFTYGRILKIMWKGFADY